MLLTDQPEQLTAKVVAPIKAIFPSLQPIDVPPSNVQSSNNTGMAYRPYSNRFLHTLHRSLTKIAIRRGERTQNSMEVTINFRNDYHTPTVVDAEQTLERLIHVTGANHTTSAATWRVQRHTDYSAARRQHILNVMPPLMYSAQLSASETQDDLSSAENCANETASHGDTIHGATAVPQTAGKVRRRLDAFLLHKGSFNLGNTETELS